MAENEQSETRLEPIKSDENARGPGGPLALDTTLKKTFTAVVALVGVLAGISVFTAPFAKTGPALISSTVVALAVIMVVAAGVVALYTYRKKTITTSVWVMVGVAILVLAAGTGVGYSIWHARSSPTSTGTPRTGTSSSPTLPASVATGHTAQVAWTDDGGGGGSTSTTLYAFTGPNTHIHDGAYPLGDSMTVVCQTPNGRAIQVGPTYKGPDPHSTVWYQLDSRAWVPAVYVQVDDSNAVPTCP